MDAFVNSHRTKVGMPRADVNTLRVSYVIRTLSDCAPDDAVPDGIKMYKAINAVITASPPEFTQNLELFRWYISGRLAYKVTSPWPIEVN